MRYIWQHVEFLLANYNGSIPLTHFLKNYFRQYPKLGSRDRRILSEMMYCWYRCSKALPDKLPTEEKIKACLLICETSVRQVHQFLPYSWQQKTDATLAEKIDLLQETKINVDVCKLVAFTPILSEGITETDWLHSMVRQPRLFIRVREKVQQVKQLLEKNSVAYDVVNDHCLSLANSSAVDKILPAHWYLVQDASSQQTGNYFQPKAKEHWWDCCSGAGGKSLLLKDIQSDIFLTVSDKRQSILHNLSERFRLYNHQQPQKIVLDAANKQDLKHLGKERFDNIICDVPCSGSGTWARTPEQLYFFEENTIEKFATLQKTIAQNVLQYLKLGGRMVYITCSVFRQENEDVVNSLLNAKIMLTEKHLINGIEKKADSMFVAVLQKNG